MLSPLGGLLSASYTLTTRFYIPPCYTIFPFFNNIGKNITIRPLRYGLYDTALGRLLWDRKITMGQKKTFLAHVFFRNHFRISNGNKKMEKTEEVIRKILIREIVPRYTKASLGRTDARAQVRLQTQTSCGMETGMDNCVAAVAVAVAAYRTPQEEDREYRSVGTRSEVARRGRCNRVRTTYILLM